MEHSRDEPYLFVSYASVDRETVLAVTAGLRDAGIPVWIDTAGIAGGTAYGTEIATALRDAAAVLVMCSEASLTSKNVRQEIMLAWRYERPIVPLFLEQVSFPDDIAYWLEGSTWIELDAGLDRDWLQQVLVSLRRYGVDFPNQLVDATGDSDGQMPTSAGNLVRGARPLVGREREIEEIMALLRNSRWLTLTGPGGTGKTSLATETGYRLAGDFSGGAWLVNLAPVSDKNRIIEEVASALDVPDEAHATRFETVAAFLDIEPVMLLLDNLEQIKDAGSVIEELVGRCPKLTVIATSRAPLSGSHEWVYSVSPLPLPDASVAASPASLSANPSVALFIERARETVPDFTLTEANARAVVEICRRLDGLPLAIELAAARVRLLPPAAILARLGSRLSLLNRGGAALSARHQTLRDTIDWSYGLLADPEQRLFRRISVYPAGCRLDAAIATDPEVDEQLVIDGLTTLADHSLLRIEPAVDGASRVRMLETIREFAEDMLSRENELDVARALASDHISQFVSGFEDELRNSNPTTIALIREEEPNIRVALDDLGERARNAESTLLLVRSMLPYWRTRGQMAEAERRTASFMPADDVKMPGLKADLLAGQAVMAASAGKLEQSQDLYAHSLALRQSIGDQIGEATSLVSLAWIASDLGELDNAASLLDRALVIRRDLEDEQGQAEVQHDLGMVQLYRGDYAGASQRLKASLESYRKSPIPKVLGGVLDDLGTVEMLQGHQDAALAYQAEALAIWRTLADNYAISWCVVNNGRALQLAGRYEEATDRLEEAIRLFEETGEQAGVSLALYGLGLIALDTENPEEARTMLRQSLELLGAATEPWHVSERLEAFAELEAGSDPWRAASLLAAAERIRHESGVERPPIDEPRHERTVERLRDQMSDGDYEIATATGSQLPTADAIELALR